MSYKTIKLTVKDGGMFTRTNEETKEVTTCYRYIVSKNNPKEAIQQLLEDQRLAHEARMEKYGITEEFQPKKDDAGNYIHIGYAPLLPGSKEIFRTSKGRWMPENAKMQQINYMIGAYPKMADSLTRTIAMIILEMDAAPVHDYPQDITPEETPTPDNQDFGQF